MQRCARALGFATTIEEPQTAERDAPEKYPKDKNKITREKTNTIFNKVRQFAYVLGVREREILLIQQSITICSFLQEIFKGDFQWGTIHEGSNPYYSI